MGSLLEENRLYKSYKDLALKASVYKEELKIEKNTNKKMESIINQMHDEIVSRDNILKKKNQVIKEYERRSEIAKEYSYALEYPDSDITLKQIQYGLVLEEKYDLSLHLVMNLIRLESGFNKDATNSKSTARGYGQFLIGTGEYVWEDLLKRDNYSHDKAFDPYNNLDMQFAYLNELLNTDNGSIRNALIAYNGNELGPKYYNIIDRTLRTNTDLNLDILERNWKNKN